MYFLRFSSKKLPPGRNIFIILLYESSHHRSPSDNLPRSDGTLRKSNRTRLRRSGRSAMDFNGRRTPGRSVPFGLVVNARICRRSVSRTRQLLRRLDEKSDECAHQLQRRIPALLVLPRGLRRRTRRIHPLLTKNSVNLPF